MIITETLLRGNANRSGWGSAPNSRNSPRLWPMGIVMATVFRLERTGPDRARLSVFRESDTGTRRVSEVTGRIKSLRYISADALGRALEESEPPAPRRPTR